MQVVSVEGTQATLSWKSIPCCHQNGKILNYLIQYSLILPSGLSILEQVNTAKDSREITLYGLRANSQYSAKVAGVNHVGVGNFSKPVRFITPGGKNDQSMLKYDY